MNLNSYRADEPHVGHVVYEHVPHGRPYRRGTITREGDGTWDVVLDCDVECRRITPQTFTGLVRGAFTCLGQGNLAGMMFWEVRVGRVGTPRLLRLAQEAGADSVDSALPLRSRAQFDAFVGAL